MNLANITTLFRIAILPVIIYLIYIENVTAYIWAFLLLMAAVLSDVLDGYLARKRNEVTKVGSFLDPFSDKLFTVAILFVFYLRDEFWLLAFAMFIARDLIVAGIRWYASQDDVELNRWLPGKVVTNVQFLVVASLIVKNLLFYDGMASFGLMLVADMAVFWLTFIAVVIAIISMVQYAILYVNGLNERIKRGKKLKRERMVILANKRSRGYRDNYRRRLLKRFAERRSMRVQFLPNRRKMYKGIGKNATNADQIIIAGGDGSFEGALNYKPFHKKSLGFFPLGAGNAFYSYFYRGKRFEYLRSRFNFNETDLDILEMEWDKGKTQTTFMTIGVDAEVMRLSQIDRTQHGLFDYIKGSWRAIFKIKANYELKCTVDSKKYNLDNCVNFTIAKIPYYGFNIRSLVGKVNPDDGKVYGLAIVNAHSIFLNKALRIWALLLSALHMNKSPLLPLKGKKFTVKSEVPFPIQAGGEFLGYTNWLKIKVVRKQKVLVI
jgi:CDP-diacylglycerol---glycerol-3-phosphate 3-phosphatidyltransferase